MKKRLFPQTWNLKSVLLLVFLVCAALLGIQWLWLWFYNCRDETAALQSYLRDACAARDQQLYQENVRYFQDYNDRDTYIQNLQALYQGVDAAQVSLAPDAYSWTDSDHYYNAVYQGRTIARLEAKRTGGLHRWKVRTDFGSGYYTVNLLDKDAAVSVNGIRLASDPVQTGFTDSVFPGTPIPASLDIAGRYEIRGLLTQPQLTVTSADYDVVLDSDARTFYAGRKPDDGAAEEYRNAMKEAAFAYARYTTADIRYYDLTRLLYPDTDLYTAVSNFDNQWFYDHQSYDFQNVECTHLLALGSDAFAGTIRFDYVIQADKQKVFPLCYQLFFARDESGQWMLVKLEEMD